MKYFRKPVPSNHQKDGNQFNFSDKAAHQNEPTEFTDGSLAGRLAAAYRSKLKSKLPQLPKDNPKPMGISNGLSRLDSNTEK